MIVVPNAKDIQVNVLANTYDASPKAPVWRWVQDGLLRYIDKAKSRDFLKSAGLQLPSTLLEARSSRKKILVDSDLVKYRAENNAKLSRDTAKQNGITEQQSSIENVQAYAESLLDGLTNKPPLHVVQMAADLPFNAPKDAKGAIWRGRMYLVADNLSTSEDTREVVAHELVGHFGMRGFFGEELDVILDEIHKNNLERCENKLMESDPINIAAMNKL